MLNIPTTFRMVPFTVFLLPFFCASLVKSQAFQPNVLSGPPNDGVPTEDEVQKLFKQIQEEKTNANLTLMQDSVESRRKQHRFPLPEDWTNPIHQTPMECGGSYEVAKYGFIRFVLDSRDDPCYLAFIGSRAERCSVGVMCDGIVTLTEGNFMNCENNYLKIGDGTTGAFEAWCQFTFPWPLVARNKGTDLYLVYRGSSPQSPCVAFCTEDLQYSKVAIQYAQLLGKSSFAGFPPVGTGSCDCGIRNNIGRIVGGATALKFEFPWLAALVFNGIPSFERIPFCDGALISDSHVITAAHCFDVVTSPEEFQVLLHAHVMDKTPNNGDFTEAEAANTPGWNLPKSTDRSEHSIRLDIEEIVTHPFFDKRTFDYDVAILKLKTKVNLNSGKVSPICLPYMNELFDFKDHENMVVAGWGASAEKAKVSNRLLQKLDVPFVDHRRCVKHMPTASKRHLCAGYHGGGRDSCSGDSGGPLIYNFNPYEDQFLLSGIVSAGAGCARRSKLGLYTDVQQIIQWVYHHTTGDESVKWCSR